MSEEQKKDLKRFFSIKEVAEEFGVNETLLRFWEKEFPQISPKKGGRGIRFYTRDDIEQIRIIYNLVKVRGLKIAAARDLLRKNKEGTTQAVEAVEHLRNARAALVELRNQLSEMYKRQWLRTKPPSCARNAATTRLNGWDAARRAAAGTR